MKLVNDICHDIQNYWNQVPSNTGSRALFAMGVGFIVQTLLTGNPSRGMTCAALSGLATVIHGLVSPLFKTLAGHSHLTWGEEMCRTFIAIIGAGCVAQQFGNSSIIKNLGVLTLFWGFITYIEPSRRNVNSCNWLIA
jgi:hypothetical protein